MDGIKKIIEHLENKFEISIEDNGDDYNYFINSDVHCTIRDLAYIYKNELDIWLIEKYNHFFCTEMNNQNKNIPSFENWHKENAVKHT